MPPNDRRSSGPEIFDLQALPSEIRRQTYGYVLGNQAVHIGVKSSVFEGTFRVERLLVHSLCKATTSTAEVYEHFAKPLEDTTGSPEPGAGPGSKYIRERAIDMVVSERHRGCKIPPFTTHNRGLPQTLDIGLVRASRLANIEGGQVLYSSTTFVFQRVRTAEEFLSTVPKRFKPFVRHVRLNLKLVGPQPDFERFLA